MAIIPQPFLFSWEEIDEASDLDRLRLVLGALPDEALVSFLEERRGRGRDDYPIRPMWNAVIAGIVFQHPSAAALLRELRRLAFVGFEKDRNALKYRCPAAAFGFTCSGRCQCEALSPVGVGDFGRIVRVPLKLDRRIFTPIARPTDKWKKAYARRSSVERVNSRIDQVLGFEHHNIRGSAKMKMRVTLALAVLLAMALGRIRSGQSDKMRSLTSPIVRAA